MPLFYSNLDSLLLGLPMLVMVLACLFRLDQLLVASRKPMRPGLRFSDWDKNGRPICPDPCHTTHSGANRNRRVFIDVSDSSECVPTENPPITE